MKTSSTRHTAIRGGGFRGTGFDAAARHVAKPAAVLNGVLVFRDTSVPGDGVSAAIAIAAPLGWNLPFRRRSPHSNAHVGAYSGLAGLGLITALLLALAGGMSST